MKRLFIVGILVLFFCAGIFAQNFTVDAFISFSNYGWDNSDATSTSSVYLTIGYYVIEDFNIGLRAYFNKPANGSTYGIGPRVKFDFLKFENIYFSMFGTLFYTTYSGSYSFNNGYYDANRVSISLDPTVFFVISKNIEVYWDFATIIYRYDWLRYGGRDRSYQYFNLGGPYSDPTFGLMFRF